MKDNGIEYQRYWQKGRHKGQVPDNQNILCNKNVSNNNDELIGKNIFWNDTIDRNILLSMSKKRKKMSHEKRMRTPAMRTNKKASTNS